MRSISRFRLLTAASAIIPPLLLLGPAPAIGQTGGAGGGSSGGSSFGGSAGSSAGGVSSGSGGSIGAASPSATLSHGITGENYAPPPLGAGAAGTLPQTGLAGSSLLGASAPPFGSTGTGLSGAALNSGSGSSMPPGTQGSTLSSNGQQGAIGRQTTGRQTGTSGPVAGGTISIVPQGLPASLTDTPATTQ